MQRNLPRRRFEHLAPRAGCAALALLLASCTDATEPEGRTAGADLLLITLDTTRADALGCYGGPEYTTPTLDELARRGVRFEQARSVAPITLPSHASILTGLYPHEHGVRDNGTFVLPSGTPTLAGRLEAAGYRTFAVTGSVVLHSRHGLDQGFQRYSDVLPSTIGASGGEERDAAAVVSEALGLLQSLTPADRFFLWVHFFDPHFPYAAPPAAVAQLPPGTRPEAAANPRQQRDLAYFAELAHVDRQLDRLLHGLEQLGREDVLIAVTADHGEGLGDHGEATHAYLIYDSTLRVPLLLHHPRMPSGVTVQRSVSAVDLAPTLLALLGLPGLETHGIDLSGSLGGEGPEGPARPLLMETCGAWYGYGWAPLWGVLEWPYKTILGPRVEVFDVSRDAGELTDLSEDRPDLVQRAAVFLDRVSLDAAEPELRELSEEESAALRALGYVGNQADPAGETPPVPGWIPAGNRDPRDGVPLLQEVSRCNRLWNTGRHEEALAGLEELVAADPGNPSFLATLGGLLLQVGRPEDAVPVLARGVELSRFPSTRELLAQCLNRAGRFEEAMEVLAEGIARSPDHASYRLNLARLLLARDRPAEALEILAPLRGRLAAGDPTAPELAALLQRARDLLEVDGEDS